jgi:hypothetical protein
MRTHHIARLTGEPANRGWSELLSQRVPELYSLGNHGDNGSHESQYATEIQVKVTMSHHRALLSEGPVLAHRAFVRLGDTFAAFSTLQGQNGR